MNDQLLDAVHSHQQDMIQFTRDLVAIPTENPPGRAYRPCVERIARELDKLGLQYTTTEVPRSDPRETAEPRYCLSSPFGTGKRTLYFHGHYDVVPASNSNQFQPYVKGRNLFGRGSSDMKSGLASMVYAVKALKDCGVELDGKICLTFVPDEETGGQQGSEYLAAAGLLGRDGIGMLMPEPTSGLVWNASRGAISLLVTVRGKPAHVGLHYQGVNAFEGMLAVVAALRNYKAEVEERKTMENIDPDAARRSIMLLGGRCEGGRNFNVVPDICSFTIDRRINPEEDLVAEKQQLLGILENVKRGGVDLDVEIFQEAESAGVSKETALGRALSDSIEKVTSKPPVFTMCPGLLEIRFYARRGVPAFAYGPGLLSVSHGPHEFVKLKDIASCAAVYALTATQVLTR
jgi:acetylornithine deacetylase/succinyl-diaminopimelate desuccinylase family protein